MLAEQLKNSILQAAIQGKLTDQRKEDGNAQDLYNQIQEEKQKLIKEKKIKKEKPLPEITADEVPFDIPKNWMWVRLGRLITVISGVSYKKKDVCEAGVRILRGGNIQNLKVNISASDVFLPNMYFDKTKQVKVGDVLIVASTGSKTVIGKPGYIEYELPRTMIGAFLRICRPICKETSTYLYRIFCSEYYRQHIRNLAQGTNINNVKEEYITQLMSPLPPLAEQKRIADTIQKYLAEIEQLEKDEEALAELQKAFPGKMKASILQQAIQGKLTDQRKEDGSAQDLYNQIQEEKQKLIKEKKIKKTKSLPKIEDDEIPFEIPENWCWVRLGDVGLLQTGITPSKAHPEFYGNEIPFVGPGDIFENYRLNYHKNGLSSEGLKHARVIAENSVMQVCIGGSIGKAVINDRKVTCNQQINTITPYFIETKYIFYCMISRYFVSSLRMKAGGSATPIINRTKWAMMPVPLPPLAEQKRIVEKLDKLLPLCEA